jgi:hypothetical protein
MVQLNPLNFWHPAMDRHWRLQRPMSCLAGFSVLLCCCAGLAAARPLADTSLALSQVVWRPEKTQQYVGSPGIVALPNGSYLASHDDFGSGSVRIQQEAASDILASSTICCPCCSYQPLRPAHLRT